MKGKLWNSKITIFLLALALVCTGSNLVVAAEDKPEGYFDELADLAATNFQTAYNLPIFK